MSIEAWIVVIIVLIAVFGFSRGVLRSKCPRCGALGNFHKTGNSKVPDNVWGADVFDEYCCKLCGHSEWVKQRTNLR